MIRDTTYEAYCRVVESGVLSKRRCEVYIALFTRGPCTASELAQFMNMVKGAQSNQNVVTRLGELRDSGCVDELPKVECSITGFMAYQWKVNGKIPIKFEKPTHRKCPTCKGKGILIEQQATFL